MVSKLAPILISVVSTGPGHIDPDSTDGKSTSILAASVETRSAVLRRSSTQRIAYRHRHSLWVRQS